jgi:hypothetical protein
MLSVVSQWALNFGCWVQHGRLLNKVRKTHIILLSRAVSKKVKQAAWCAGLMEFPLVLTTLSLQRLFATIGVWMFITLCSVNLILNSLPPLLWHIITALGITACEGLMLFWSFSTCSTQLNRLVLCEMGWDARYSHSFCCVASSKMKRKPQKCQNYAGRTGKDTWNFHMNGVQLCAIVCLGLQPHCDAGPTSYTCGQICVTS